MTHLGDDGYELYVQQYAVVEAKNEEEAEKKAETFWTLEKELDQMADESKEQGFQYAYSSDFDGDIIWCNKLETDDVSLISSRHTESTARLNDLFRYDNDPKNSLAVQLALYETKLARHEHDKATYLKIQDTFGFVSDPIIVHEKWTSENDIEHDESYRK